MDKTEIQAPRTLYTVSEVAGALRVSSETIRRKIAQGELRAIEVTRTPRKQYRITLRDLSAWLGEDQARAIFGIGDALAMLRAVLAELSDTDQATLLEEAKAWARTQTPDRERVGRTVSADAIAERFGPPH